MIGNKVLKVKKLELIGEATSGLKGSYVVTLFS
jgi:hypothetical protein